MHTIFLKSDTKVRFLQRVWCKFRTKKTEGVVSQTHRDHKGSHRYWCTFSWFLYVHRAMWKQGMFFYGLIRQESDVLIPNSCEFFFNKKGSELQSSFLNISISLYPSGPRRCHCSLTAGKINYRQNWDWENNNVDKQTLTHARCHTLSNRPT